MITTIDASELTKDKFQELLKNKLAEAKNNGMAGIGLKIGSREDLENILGNLAGALHQAIEDEEHNCKGTCEHHEQIGQLSEAKVVEEEEEPKEEGPQEGQTSASSGNNFGQALEALEAGGIVWRDNWGRGVGDFFAFRQVPAQIKMSVVAGMQSLPHAAKKNLIRRNLNNPGSEAYKSIRYDNQLAIVMDDNQIESWIPDVEDMRANDWNISF